MFDVAEYYDTVTQHFLSTGGSGELAAIHRQIWAPGVTTAHQSFEYLNQIVIENLPMPAERVLDLGCGVGGTATWLASQRAVSIVDVTISAVQAQLAQERAARLGVAERCQFIQADFLHLPELGRFQAAYALESFSHASAGARFFQQAAQVVEPGGRLILADDFLAHDQPPNGEATQWLEQFRQGWRFASLMTVARAITLAADAGWHLVTDHHLTPHLRLVPGWLAYWGGIVLRLPVRSTMWQSYSGSTALQYCLRRGWTQYHALVWENVKRDA